MTTRPLPVEQPRDAAPPAFESPAFESPAFESKAVTRVRGLGDLMARRPELSGVYGPADVAAESVRWSA